METNQPDDSPTPHAETTQPVPVVPMAQTAPHGRGIPRPRRTPPPRARRPLFAAVAAILVLFAVGCTILALADDSGPFVAFGLGAQASPTAMPSVTLPTPFPTINDGPSYASTPPASPTAGPNTTAAAATSSYGCPNGTPRAAPSYPIFGETHKSYATANKEIALTFDDGPSNANSDTPQLLHWLEANHVAASFMVVGVRVQSDGAALREEYRDGFDIGVHTWDHPDMTRLSVTGMRQELASDIAAIKQAVGSKACVWLWRPPYGAFNSTVIAQAQHYGLSTIMWDMDPQDWATPGINTIVSRVESAAHPGAILLDHDGPGGRWETLAAVKIYVPYLEAHGYHFVTLSQLIRDSHYPPSGPPKTVTIPRRGLTPRESFETAPTVTAGSATDHVPSTAANASFADIRARRE